MRKGDVLLRVVDGRAFAWRSEHPNCLLALPIEGTFESRETGFVRCWVRPGDVVFDVGANFGWYTTLFRQCLAGEGQVHSFEPTPAAFNALQEHLVLNPSPTQTETNRVALGESSGSVRMWIPWRGGRGTAFASLRQQDRIGRHECIDVQVTTVSDYASTKRLGKIDLIKCDVEGAEMLVLRGAADIMDRGIRPAWLIEVSDDHMRKFGYCVSDLADALLARNYLICDIQLDGTLLLASRSDLGRFDNAVFVPSERARLQQVAGQTLVQRG